jgi:hypothetical protein
LVVTKTLSFETCREHETHSWSVQCRTTTTTTTHERDSESLQHTTTLHINAATVTTTAAAAASGKLSAKLMWSPILQQWVSMILNQLVADQLHCPLSLSKPSLSAFSLFSLFSQCTREVKIVLV